MESPFSPPPPIPKASGPVQLILPPTEDRPHKYFTLPNGIEVIVVSDPKADKAAASMEVGVGHLSDPDDLPGCAHFCEHLLFMGTKSFPKENEYQDFLTKNGGGSNAGTGMTSTNYYFDVSPDALQGALERFSGFFSEPLFNESCTEREIQAVDSEHKKNLQNDMWRFYQLSKHLSKTGHPYRKFGTGNYETLWSKPQAAGRDPRQQLMKWWEKNYCARRMKLAIAGKDDVETLEKWVREYFERVPVRSKGWPEVGPEGVRIVFEDHPLGPEQWGQVTFVKPVTETRGMEITIPFPDIQHLYESKPSQFLSHFLGHEGRGSVLSYLKKQGWVNTLRAGPSGGDNGFDLFKIAVDFTPEGLEHYEETAMAIFKYFTLLRSQPPSKEAFDEIKAIADITFRFAERQRVGSYVNHLADWMTRPVPREKIVSSAYLVEEYQPDEITAALNLLDPRKALIGVTCRELPKGVEGSFDQKEPIYGTEYKTIKLSDKFLQEAMGGKPVSAMKLPGPNLFIPEKFDVEKFNVDHPALRPKLLSDTPLSRLWYKRDDRFWLPKSNVIISLSSPILDVTPRQYVLTKLLTELFQDSITEDIYDADLANLSFGVSSGNHELYVSAQGFSDKLSALTEAMLLKLVAFEVDPQRFDEIKDALELSWKNFELKPPHSLASYWASYAQCPPNVWTSAERLVEIQHVTAADVQAFAKDAFGRLYVEMLVHGNISSEGAKGIQNMIERVLRPRSLTDAEKVARRSLSLPDSSSFVYRLPVPNSAEVNSAVDYRLQIGDPSDTPLRAHLQIFHQIAKEPLFDHLRTKEQLGYITMGSTTSGPGTMGYRVVVQSERDPIHVENRIEAFLEWLKGHIEEMSEEEWEEHKQAIISKKQETPKNLGEETSRFWGSITDRYYEFGKRETDIANIRSTKKPDLLRTFMTHIHPSSSSTRKLSVHMKSQYQGVKFDATSLAPITTAFGKHGIAVDQSALQSLLGSKPDLEKVKTFARSAVAKVESLSQEVKSELENIIEALKPTGEEVELKLREGNVWIEDIQEFKAGLIPSKAPLPIEPLKLDAKL
ncbi:insulysin [Tremella mesenterica]|uniref:Insulysin n=1 Tax=Tremella mesenterica TaxID=5217 RepID=A0A4Q1BJY9_TREME|nr:insulysin [Tremella mesenterica]